MRKEAYAAVCTNEDCELWGCPEKYPRKSRCPKCGHERRPTTAPIGRGDPL
jgi:rRNA maturation endonuclease Nob1